MLASHSFMLNKLKKVVTINMQSWPNPAELQVPVDPVTSGGQLYCHWNHCKSDYCISPCTWLCTMSLGTYLIDITFSLVYSFLTLLMFRNKMITSVWRLWFWCLLSALSATTASNTDMVSTLMERWLKNCRGDGLFLSQCPSIRQKPDNLTYSFCGRTVTLEIYQRSVWRPSRV